MGIQVQTTALASSLVIPRPVKVKWIIVHNTSGATQYIQLHDSATLPNDGAGVFCGPFMAIAAGETKSLDFGSEPYELSNGLAICNSSTPNFKTIGAADCSIFVSLARS